MPTAMDAARYFLAEPRDDGSPWEKRPINLAKLQKLVCYAQALCLATDKKPLFDEDMEAWDHGPVVPSLNEYYRDYGDKPLPSSGLTTVQAREPFDNEQKFLLEYVAVNFSEFSPRILSNISHEDFPGDWGTKETIAKEAIAERFQDQEDVKFLTSYKPPEGPMEMADTAEVERVLALYL